MEVINIQKNTQKNFGASIIKEATIDVVGKKLIEEYAVEKGRIMNKNDFVPKIRRYINNDILILDKKDKVPQDSVDLRRLKNRSKYISSKEIFEDIRNQRQLENRKKVVGIATLGAGILAFLLSINSVQGKKPSIDDKYIPPNDCILPRQSSCSKEFRYEELIKNETRALTTKINVIKRISLCRIPRAHRKALHPLLKIPNIRKINYTAKKSLGHIV